MLHVDFSKQKLNQETLSKLFVLTKNVSLKSAVNDMFSGKCVNATENRPSLHTALRTDKQEELSVDGEDIIKKVHQELERMAQIVDKIHSEQWKGFSGKTITDVVNLGVGGSELGPMLVCDSLSEFKQNNAVNVHFVSSMDGIQLSSLFRSLNRETTLFIVVSKSFSTIDILSNAATAKDWLIDGSGVEELIRQRHFIGISADKNKMDMWGLLRKSTTILGLGRRTFSLWSTVGLSIAIKLGMKKFHKLLKGACSMYKHFQAAEFKDNLPVLLGLVVIWNINFN